MSKTMLKTVAVAVAAIAIINRIPAAKDALTGDDKFLGIF